MSSKTVTALLRVPWTVRRSNQSILKETSPGCSLEGLMLRLKLQYSGYLMQRVDSLEKTLMLGVVFGIMKAPSNDMSPRVDYGDLLLYFRFDRKFSLNTSAPVTEVKLRFDK